jgi:thioredoxin
MKQIKNLFRASALLMALFFSACNSGQAGNKENENLSVVDFQKQIKASGNSNIVDVRTPEEYKGGHLEHAQNIDWNGSSFESDIEKLDKNKVAFLYCLSGGRSAAAAAYMREHGFKKVYEMQGGMMAWRSQNLPEVIDLKTEKKPGMNKSDFDKETASNNKVLVDFYAEWCMPCKKMQPFLEEIAKERTEVKVLRINADENMDLCKELGIEALPVVLYYAGGKLMWRKDGFQSKEVLIQNLK